MRRGCVMVDSARSDAPLVPTVEPDDDLPFVRYSDIEVPPEADRWLIDGLWPLDAVGILGGSSKLGKSILTVETAVAVASGEPLFGVYPVNEPGLVLICFMEGQTWLAPDRIRKVARFRGLGANAALPIEVLDRARLRLDDTDDLRRLMGAVQRRQPRLIILDPLVRLHTADENASIGGVSKVLDDLRFLQRTCRVCILVVHHNRKNVRRGERPGIGLRGSTDIHAWGDCNWYLRENGKTGVTLTVEHRTAVSPDPIRLQLAGDDEHLHFDILCDGSEPDENEPPVTGVAERVIEILRTSPRGSGSTTSGSVWVPAPLPSVRR